MNVAMILSGGVGRRFGAEIPKQYQDLLGKPVVTYVTEAALRAKSIDKVLVVCAKEYFDFLRRTEWKRARAERSVTFLSVTVWNM